MVLRNPVFEDSVIEVLEELGFKISWDLVTQVAYKECLREDNKYVVLTADGEAYTMVTTDPETTLGCY